MFKEFLSFETEKIILNKIPISLKFRLFNRLNFSSKRIYIRYEYV